MLMLLQKSKTKTILKAVQGVTKNYKIEVGTLARILHMKIRRKVIIFLNLLVPL